VRGTAISLQALAAFKSNAAERPSGTPRGYVEHFRQKRWPDGEFVIAFLQGHTVTPPSMQKTSVGQVDSRRLKHVAKKTVQGISVSIMFCFAHLEHIN